MHKKPVPIQFIAYSILTVLQNIQKSVHEFVFCLYVLDWYIRILKKDFSERIKFVSIYFLPGEVISASRSRSLDQHDHNDPGVHLFV